VPPSLWCIALQLSKLMQADDAFGDAFIGMIAVFSQLTKIAALSEVWACDVVFLPLLKTPLPFSRTIVHKLFDPT
jgi:hypothetical protein